MLNKILNMIETNINVYNFKKNKVLIGHKYKFHGIIFMRNFGIIRIGDNFKATSGKRYNPIGGDTVLRIYCRKNAKIIIGNNLGVSNSTFHIANELIIKDNVMIGGGCKIWDSDFHSLDPKERIFNGDKNVLSKPIYIDNNVFIGASSIILKGVHIGENSIIGAGSVVTKDIPKNEIWAGNPAEKIRSLALCQLCI